MHDIFYFTDIHGMYDLYRAMMDYCITQDPECMIIYGGDACDRGRNGYKIMQELLDDSHVLYLKGNHEDLFVQAARAIIKDYKGQFEEDQIWDYLFNIETSQYGDKEIQLCLYNGGYWTLHDWMMDGMPSSFIARINALPITFSYENIVF